MFYICHSVSLLRYAFMKFYIVVGWHLTSQNANTMFTWRVAKRKSGSARADHCQADFDYTIAECSKSQATKPSMGYSSVGCVYVRMWVHINIAGITEKENDIVSFIDKDGCRIV